MQSLNNVAQRIAGRLRRYILVVLAAAALIVGYLIGAAGKEPSHEGHAAAPAAEEGETVWTCSMHPQIQRSEPGLCPICNMDLIPMAAGHSGGLRELSVSEEAAKLMSIEVSPVERRFVTAEVRMVGKIDYDETNLAYISAWVAGRLDRLFVDYTGVTVRKGDRMVYLYSPELISSQEELLGALASVRNISESDLDVMRRLTEETVKAAREKLRLLGLAEEQIAEIEATGEVQDHITINAPVGGIVIQKNAVEGMYVQTGTRIYTIANLERVWVKLDAYESDLGWLRYGQEVQFTTVSYPGSVFRGVISFIDPVLDETTRTVKVRVNVENPEGRLKPGMFVRAVVDSRVGAGNRIMDTDMIGKWICPMHPEIVKDEPGRCDVCEMALVSTESMGYAGEAVDPAARPLVIPASAPLITGTRAIVYVKQPDTEAPTFEGREVLLGARAGDYYIVRSGLEEGELVVTKGNFKIDSALQLSARPSMMTREAGGSAAAGHAHGHEAEAEEIGVAGTEAVDLPVLSRHQMKKVVRAGEEIARLVEDRDPAKSRNAFGRLAEAIDEVDMSLLTGDAHHFWMEYRMRLRNDAVEGKEAETARDLQRAAESLQRNIMAMKRTFGLFEHVKEPHVAIPGVFATQLKSLYDAYFAMQMALADDDVEKAGSAAEDIGNRVREVDATVLPAALQDNWNNAANAIAMSLDKIDGADIARIREEFYPLSQAMIEIARRFGAAGEQPVYVAFCPMAFEDRGASWLQAGTEIRNPYFGEMMLKCGETREVIEPRTRLREEHGSHE